MTNKYAFKKIDWVNSSVLLGFPVLFCITLYLHIKFEGFNPYLFIPFFFFYIMSGLGITAGYHRLFSHRAYQANPVVKFLYLIFGAAAVQNSALKWSTDHRRHHQFCDTETDPYNINEGFFYAHMGWVLLKEDKQYKDKYVKDLESDPMVMWQHNHYLAIVLTIALVIPVLVGWMMGSPIGGFAILALGRLLVVHHTTFFINSLCHCVGSQPYNDGNTARDSALMALFTYGEGYHNFHHMFQTDYRNGVKWWQWDPTKWLIKTLYWAGLASNLKETPDVRILQAQMQMKLKKLKRTKPFIDLSNLESLQLRVEAAQKKWQDLKKEYEEMKVRLPVDGAEKLRQFKENIQRAKDEFRQNYQTWVEQIRSLEMQGAMA